MRSIIIASSVLTVCCAGTASAVIVNDFDASMSFAGSNLNGIVGTGISNANFARSTNADEGIEIGLKAIARFMGDLPNTDERYFAQPGVSAGPPPGATWNYVLVGNLGPRTIADLQIDLAIDFDPTFGSALFTNVDITAGAIAQGFGGLSILGDSQNLDFDFWQILFGAPAFDPNAPGEYELVFTVRDPANSAILAEAVNIVEVVPTPGAAALLGLGSITAMRRRR